MTHVITSAFSDVRVTTVSGSIFAGFIAAAPQLNMGKMMKARKIS